MVEGGVGLPRKLVVAVAALSGGIGPADGRGVMVVVWGVFYALMNGRAVATPILRPCMLALFFGI